MRKIYKYCLNLMGETRCKIPLMAEDSETGCIGGIISQVLHVGQQNGLPVVWVMVDPNAPLREVVFRSIMTGEPFDGLEPYEHIGTAILYNGSFVAHVFAQEAESLEAQEE